MSQRKKGPGRSEREGLSIIQLLELYPDDASAEAWFIAQRWLNGRFCPDCGSINTAECKNRKPMPYRCRDCRKHFSVRKGTVMQCSKLGLRTWLIAVYLMTTGIKGTASMKVYRDLRIRQPSAWHLMHRLREAFRDGASLPMPGPVEVDEMYVGGIVKNMHKDKRKEHKGTGGANKTIVAGAKDRATGQVSAAIVPNTSRASLQGFITERTRTEATIYTDELASYVRIPRKRESVRHTAGEYVRGPVHTNGIESFWALFKRAHKGTYHKMSKKHLGRYVNEFAGRHNIRDLDTRAQMSVIAQRLIGKRLRYRDLVG